MGEGVIWSVERWMSQYLDHVLCKEVSSLTHVLACKLLRALDPPGEAEW